MHNLRSSYSGHTLPTMVTQSSCSRCLNVFFVFWNFSLIEGVCVAGGEGGILGVEAVCHTVTAKEALAWRKREDLFLWDSRRYHVDCGWHSFTFIEIFFPLGSKGNVPKAIIPSIDSSGFHGCGTLSQVVQKWPLWAKVQPEWRFWDGDYRPVSCLEGSKCKIIYDAWYNHIKHSAMFTEWATPCLITLPP